jgi:hypothetical protein
MAGGVNKAKSRRSSRHKQKYAVQKLKTFKNKQRKLLRHTKLHPNDAAGATALKNLK